MSKLPAAVAMLMTVPRQPTSSMAHVIVPRSEYAERERSADCFARCSRWPSRPSLEPLLHTYEQALQIRCDQCDWRIDGGRFRCAEPSASARDTQFDFAGMPAFKSTTSFIAVFSTCMSQALTSSMAMP